MTPKAQVEAERMSGIQALSRRTSGIQFTTRGHSITEPRTDLDGPRQIPLASSTAGKGELGLGESNVFTHFQTHHRSPPLGGIRFIMGMAGHTDEAPPLGLTMPKEIVPQLVIAFPPSQGLGIIAHAARWFDIPVFKRLEIGAQHRLPPACIRTQAMEVISPFPQLDGLKHSGMVQQTDGFFVLTTQHTGAPLDLHTATLRRV